MTGLSQNGVKIRPLFTSSKPSGTMSSSCGMTSSPNGKGCVAAVAWRGLCGTARAAVPARVSSCRRWHRELAEADERLAGLAIEDVDESRLADLGDSLARLAVVDRVEQDHGIWGVVVPEIVMHLLEMPAVLPGLRVDREHRDAEQVVAAAHGAIQVRTGIAGREIDEAQARVDGGRLPDGGATVLPRVVVRRASVVPELAGTGDRVERPNGLAGARVERFHAAAAAAVAARETREHEPVVVERPRRDSEAVRVRLRLHGPDDRAGALVERDELAVELARVDLAVA